MGWLSKHARNGGRMGSGGLGDRKRGAPLRKVVGHVTNNQNIFSTDRVLLECGHEADSWGGIRARCVACKGALDAPAAGGGDR